MSTAAGKTVGWGILGAGIIARKLADAVASDQNSRLLAVASKDTKRAAAFASEFSIPRACSYKELVNDPEIDIVYVATTHNFHYDCARLALESGKTVLMEKPFTVNALQAEELAALARSRGLLLVEAIWVRYLPSLIKIKQMVAEGKIGEVRQATATFGNFVLPRFEQRLKDPALAGGVTLDMGIYPISVISYILGELPSEVQSMCRFSDEGVDEVADYLFRYPSGCLAHIAASYNLRMEKRACFYGSKGYIEFDNFPAGAGFTLNLHNGTNDIVQSERIELNQHENGFVYQVAEAVRCLRSGLTETPVIPLDETIALMWVMDRMRREWGLQYDFE